MSLMTEELVKRFGQIGMQLVEKEPIVIARFYNPVGAGTWLATEYYTKSKLFYGYVSIYKDYRDEWGYFPLAQLESYKDENRVGLKRDLCWIEQSASEAIANLY